MTTEPVDCWPPEPRFYSVCSAGPHDSLGYFERCPVCNRMISGYADLKPIPLAKWRKALRIIEAVG